MFVYVDVRLGFDNSCSAENLASLCLHDRPQSGTIQGQKSIGSRGAPLPGKAPIDRKLGMKGKQYIFDVKNLILMFFT